MPTVICKGIRTTTNSTLTVEIPREVWTKDTGNLNNPNEYHHHCVQWFGEQFGWNFIPMELIQS